MGSQLAARPSLPSTPDGSAEFLMNNGWQPIGVDNEGREIWKPPVQERAVYEKDVVVPYIKDPENLNHPKAERFKRTMVKSIELACTTAQAMFRQKQKGAKVA